MNAEPKRVCAHCGRRLYKMYATRGLCRTHYLRFQKTANQALDLAQQVLVKIANDETRSPAMRACIRAGLNRGEQHK